MSIRILCAVAMVVSPTLARAQSASVSDDLKRTLLPAVMQPACPSESSPPAAPTNQQRIQARSLASRGQQATLLGDTAAALSDLRQATALDPLDADLAYQLARAYESGGATAGAVGEYCRFLALAPNTADAADARRRVAALAKPVPDSTIAAANAFFQDGLLAYDARRAMDAEEKLTRALEARPTWADAYFDRALARLAQDERDQAAGDFEAYLRANPEADDRQSVMDRVARIRRSHRSPARAFGLGVVFPGGGQFYTHQPLWGAVFLAAAGGAIGYGVVPETKTTTVQLTATDPFGNPYTYPATRREAQRPNLVPGIVAAGSITLLAAIQAATHAHRGESDEARRVSVEIGPARTSLGLRVAF